MRSAVALLIAGIALGAARGEPARKTATVEVDGVEVRAGHALAFPAVGQLKKGDSVIVVREEETGFLAIVPPAGSVSWVKQIQVGKLDGLETGKANVPVMVDGAEVLAGSEKDHKPTNRVTVHLPKGTIVEVTGQPVRIDNASWLPIAPPEGDLRWIPKNAVKSGSMTAVAPPPSYAHDSPTFTIPGVGSKEPPIAKTVAAGLPAALSDHRLWAQASRAEQSGDYATAKGLYARIYQDLWDQKAERDAIVICYNRYVRCEEMLKKGDGGSSRTHSNAPPPAAEGTTTGAKWSNPGTLQELQKVYVDGQPVYSLQDDRGNVAYYVTAVSGINLRNYAGKRVQVYGAVATRPELYKPYMTIERVEAAR
jgi:hypothetical protein